MSFLNNDSTDLSRKLLFYVRKKKYWHYLFLLLPSMNVMCFIWNLYTFSYEHLMFSPVFPVKSESFVIFPYVNIDFSFFTSCYLPGHASPAVMLSPANSELTQQHTLKVATQPMLLLLLLPLLHWIMFLPPHLLIHDYSGELQVFPR